MSIFFYWHFRTAMDTLGFSETSQEGILSLVCALLHASNLTLRAVSADESELKDDNSFLDHALELLGVTREALNYALCKFSISAGKDTYVRSLPKHKAERGLEAFIRGTYAALFNYLVHQVNLKIKQGVTNVRHSFMGGSAATIGLLDIFGFESFKKNSFEQLCINYCNEVCSFYVRYSSVYVGSCLLNCHACLHHRSFSRHCNSNLISTCSRPSRKSTNKKVSLSLRKFYFIHIY